MLGSRKQKKSSKEHCGKKKVWGKFLNVLKLSFPVSNKGIKITVKFLWTTEFKYLTHLMLKKWQSFFKGDNLFFWTSFFHEEIFISLPRKEQYLWLCGYLSAHTARSSYLSPFSVHLYFSRGVLPFDLGGQTWTPLPIFFWVRFRWWVLLFCGLLFLILLACALYIHVFLPYLYVASLSLQ